MAPSVAIVCALFHLSSADENCASQDEQSMLQMPMVDKNVALDASDCRCPGYFEEECIANAYQGCIWEEAHGSDSPWCACDPNFVPSVPLYTQPEEPVICCRALTADCMACTQGVSVEDYCAQNPDTAGCPEPPVLCCAAMSADCLACSAGVTVEQYCAQHPGTAGCPTEPPTVPPTAPPLAEGDLRFADGVDTGGRLEIYHNGAWGTICDDHFDHNDAAVACGQLGFPVDNAVTVYTHGGGTGEILLDDLGCSNEERIDQCPNRGGWGSHNCGHHEDVGIICVEHTPEEGDPAQGDLRLAAGSTSRGRLEIYNQGVWGTVCDDSFTQSDADVACRQLGFPSGADERYTHGGGGGPIWLDDITCGSGDTRLEDCNHRGWGRENCGHSEDVGIDCIADGSTVPGDGADGDIRLVDRRSNRNENSGRLEIYHNGEWGTVCDDFFSVTDGNTACRQLGFSSAHSTYTHGGGSGTIWLDNLGCTDDQTAISQCSSNGWGEHNCVHGEDVGVECV